MKKVYLMDVSRRLLIFVLLLGGYITQANAVDRRVFVFRDLPQNTMNPPAEAEYGKTMMQILNGSGSFEVYKSGIDIVGEMAKFLPGGYRHGDIIGKSLTQVMSTLELNNEISDTRRTLQNPNRLVTGETDVKVSSKSGSGVLNSNPMRFYLRVGIDGNIVAFDEFDEDDDYYTVAQVKAVTKPVVLPGLNALSLEVGSNLANVTALKTHLEGLITNAIGISGFTVSNLQIKQGGIDQSGNLLVGTYSYSFSLTPKNDVKLSMTAPNTSGVYPLSLEATNVFPTTGTTEFLVDGAIEVFDSGTTPLTINVPVKDVLSFYEGTNEAKVANLSAQIASAIQTELNRNSSNATVSNVKILKNGVGQSGDLVAQPYTYSFELTTTAAETFNFYRSNVEPGGDIDPVAVVGPVNNKVVTVFNSIEINPLINLAVWSNTLDTKSQYALSDEDLEGHIQRGLMQQVNNNTAYAGKLDIQNVRISPANGSSPLIPGTYDYTFDIFALQGDIKVRFASDATPTEVEIPDGSVESFSVIGKMVITKATVTDGSLVFPNNWGDYIYGTPISDLRNKIRLTDIDGVTIDDVTLYFVNGDDEILYDGNNTLDAGEYNIRLVFPPSDHYDYTPSVVTRGTLQSDGTYLSNTKLKVNQLPISNTVFPVFADGVGGLGKMANNTNVNRAKNQIRNNTETTVIPSDFIEDVKIYSDAGFTNEVSSGRLTPGATYSYRVILGPNYTLGTNVSASVGGTGIDFNTSQNSYDIKNAIAVQTNTLTVKLPDFISSPIKIGTYADNNAVADMLKRLIQDINPELEDLHLVPKVVVTGGTVSGTMDDNTLLSYRVTIEGDLSQTSLNFVTNGNVSSDNLVVNNAVCTFNNSLLFVVTLPTTHKLVYPGNYQIAYEKDMEPSAITRRIKSDLLLRNAGSLGNETFRVRLIEENGTNKNSVAETDGTFGYKIIITKSDNLQEIETPNNKRINVADKGSEIEITYTGSVTIVPRPTIDFTFGEFTVPYVNGLSKNQLAAMIRDSLYLANLYYVEYIDNVQITNFQISEMMGTANYRVTLSSDLDELFSEVTVNGQPFSGYTFNGKVNIVPRPVVTVNLYKYEFKREGASNEMIEKAILADLLLKNGNMMSSYIQSVTLLPTVTRDVYSYTVIFKPNDKVRKIEVRDQDGGLLIPIEIAGYTTATYVRSVRLTDDGQSLATYPLPINVKLPFWEVPFGQTAEEYAQDILDAFVLTSGAERVTVPDLNNWGVKTYLIQNETSTGSAPVRIAGDSYPQVSDLYGYEVVTGANTQFAEYYTLTYSAKDGVYLQTNGNDVIAKLALRIIPAKRTITLPEVNVTYSDINTKVALLDSVKKAVLEDPANKEFFELVAKTGVKPIKSFSVTINDMAEEGTAEAKSYPYSVSFVKKVTDNITITETGPHSLIVNSAPVVFEFPIDITYNYGKKKAAIEKDILSRFLAENEGLLSSYSCFENPADLFKIMLTTADCETEITEDMPKNGDYGYRVLVLDPNLLSNFALDNQFGNNVHFVFNSVEIGQRKLTIILPTYLAATAEEGTAAKAAFVFGRATRAEIVKQITADIVALNGSKIKSDYDLEVKLIAKGTQIDNGNPMIGDYSYTVLMTSADYRFVFKIEGAELEEGEDGLTTAVNAVKVIAPGIEITFKEEKLKGTWEVVSGTPVYKLTPLDLFPDDYGFNWISIEEDPKNPRESMNETRWNQLFTSGQLRWALFRNNKLKYEGPTLNSVLVDSVSKYDTKGTYKLRIIVGPALRTAVGNFDIQLGVNLASLEVIPAIVEVSAAQSTYQKVYGTKVTKATDLNATLDFATTPHLNAASLQAEKNVIDLFKTISPEDANVYDATARVGAYTMAVKTENDEFYLDEVFEPVLGVVYKASETTATVNVVQAPLDDYSVTISAERRYGESNSADCILVNVTNSKQINPDAFKTEILEILNKAKDASWIKWNAIDVRTDVGKYKLTLADGTKAIINDILKNFEDVTINVDSLTINPMELILTPRDVSLEYGQEIPELGYDYAAKYPMNFELPGTKELFQVEPVLTTDARATSARGDYRIYFSNPGQARNYTIIPETGTLSIGKTNQTLTWNDDDVIEIVEGDEHALSAYVTRLGAKFYSAVKYELAKQPREYVELVVTNGNEYKLIGKNITEEDIEISAWVDGTETYNAVAPVVKKVRVVASKGIGTGIRLILNNVTTVYDGTPHAVNAIVKDKNGNAYENLITYAASGSKQYVNEAPTEAGTYDVKVKATISGNLYEYEAVDKMIIEPRVVKVRAESFTIVYGEDTPDYLHAYSYDKTDFAGSVKDFPADHAPIIIAQNYKQNAGTYPLVVDIDPYIIPNHMVEGISGVLEVKKAPMTIKAEDKESVYGEDLEELTYTIDGFVKNESVAHLGFAPRLETTASKGADAGKYDITVSSSFEATNYDVTYKNGAYTIIPAEQTIKWRQDVELRADNPEGIALTASASSGLPVTYVSSDDNVAYVNEIGGTWYLTPVQPGRVTVTAYQHGNKNYFAAEAKSLEFGVDGDAVSNEQISGAVSQITVYPTLFTKDVTVLAPSAIKRIELVSLGGNLLKVINKPESRIDLSDFGNGIYLLNVTLEDGTFKSVKLIKK